MPPIEKPQGREVRVAVETWPLEDVEVRADGDGLTFRGYAAVFNSWSEDLGGFREKIRPGAFRKSLGEKRAIKMFLNHNSDIVLGSTRKGSLTLSEDDRGLLAEAALPDNEWGRPVADAIRRGDIDSMSFGFQTVKDAWDKTDSERAERELVEVRLFEVSPVTAWPAYPTTSASVRELAEQIEVEPDGLAAAFAILRAEDQRLTADQASLLTKLINARTDRPVRAAVMSPEDAVKYAAFRAALT